MTRLLDDTRLRREALRLMDCSGAFLDHAREVLRALRDAGIPAAVVGGIAVVVHGHWRATRAIDVLVAGPLERAAAVLESLGFTHDPERREFERDGIPVHFVTPEQTGLESWTPTEAEGVVTVALPDLIAMKLRSGTTNLLRAQDLADVIGLIRRHRLRGDFAHRLEKSLRPAFRKLARAIEREG